MENQSYKLKQSSMPSLANPIACIENNDLRLALPHEALKERGLTWHSFDSVEKVVSYLLHEPHAIIVAHEAIVGELLQALPANNQAAIVVITEETTPEYWLQAGACDYLPLNLIDVDRVQRALRFAALWHSSIAPSSQERFSSDDSGVAHHGVREDDELERGVLDSISAHIAVVDNEGAIKVVNEAWRRYGRENSPAGKMPERAGVGANYLQVCRLSKGTFSGGALEAHDGILSVLRGEKERFCLEYACPSKETLRWFLMMVTRLQTQKGGAVISHVDITERRLAEEALRDSETRLRMALTASRMGVWEWDVSSGELFWSPECYEIFGVKEFSGRREAFVQFLYPEDVERVHAAFDAALQNGTLYAEEFRIVRPDGAVRWVMNLGQARYSETGRPLRMLGTVRDVTDEKEAETALVESRERLRVALESGNIGLWDWDLVSGTVQYSLLWKSQLGYAEDEIKNTPDEWESRLHPDEKETVLVRVQAMIESDSPDYNIEFRMRHKDGSYRWMLSHGTIFRSPDNKALRILGSHVDITGFKETQAELIRSRAELQRSNDELERRVAERTREIELANRTLRAEAVERQMVMGALRNLVEKLEQANREVEAANATLKANEARLLRGNAVFTELTRLRASDESELHKAFSQITEAGCDLLETERCSIWLFDENCEKLRCADLFESNRAQHSQGVEIDVQNYPRYFETLRGRRAIVADDAHTFPATSEFSQSYLTPLNIASMLDTPVIIGGQMVGVLCCEHVGVMRHWKAEERTLASAIAALCSLAMESFERARAEAALRQSMAEAETAREEAERANRAKSEFLSRMSHELRTPMNSILGFAQLMEMHATDEREMERVSYILKAGQHLLHLINEVLDLARIESGRLSLSPEPVSVLSTIHLAVDMVRPLVQQRELNLIENYERCVDYYVHADQQRLSQVLLNLLSNAMKYNRKQGEVRVNCECVDNRVVRISISDTGYGIAPQHRARLFQPFERLGAEGGPIEGTGLGLALSRYLIEAMGGSIGVESTPGQGSTFWIELPLTEQKAIASGDMAASVAAIDLTNKDYTILYIEDNLANYQIIEHVLSSYPNIQLISAMQGHIGLELAHEYKPSLVLLDLHLPDITGEEVLRRLLANPATCDAPVIIISADATPNQVRRLLISGASEYLTKPLDIRRFLEVLRENLP
jgi:PAS domain S-box-containing protein